MSSRVIPLRGATQREPDYAAHTEARLDETAPGEGTPAAAIDPPEILKARDLRWYVIETLAWAATAALIGLAVAFIRLWMQHPQEVSRWIT